MDNILIQKMKLEDIENVLLLEKSHNIQILSKNILLNDLTQDNNYYLVAILNNKIVGYIGISYVLDTADLISIVVSKDYTNQGIASLLLNSILDFCKHNSISKITLEVRKSNIPAQNLYSKFGFTQIYVRKKYYDNVEDAYIYQKEL